MSTWIPSRGEVGVDEVVPVAAGARGAALVLARDALAVEAPAKLAVVLHLE